MINNDTFNALAALVKSRRTVKVAQMNGVKIEEQDLTAILELANWAPTHGRTEPWRFIVLEGAALMEFCHAHAAMYKQSVTEDVFMQEKYNNLLMPATKASHLIIVYMQRTPLTKIPVIEEVAATCAAIQNVLLGAASKGIAAIWNTSGMFFQPAMHTYLNLANEDVLLGFLYVGYTDETLKEGHRKSNILDKVSWKK